MTEIDTAAGATLAAALCVSWYCLAELSTRFSLLSADPVRLPDYLQQLYPLRQIPAIGGFRFYLTYVRSVSWS